MDTKDIIEKAGGAARLASALGIARPSVCEWKLVPPKRVADVARITGLPRHQIRPDLYEAPEPTP